MRTGVRLKCRPRVTNSPVGRQPTWAVTTCGSSSSLPVPASGVALCCPFPQSVSAGSELAPAAGATPASVEALAAYFVDLNLDEFILTTKPHG